MLKQCGPWDDDQAMNRNAMYFMGGLILFFIMILAILTLITLRVATADEDDYGTRRPPKPPVADAAFDEAMMDCMDTVSFDENGFPDREEMDACMSEKGFEKPPGRPGEGPGEPPDVEDDDA